MESKHSPIRKLPSGWEVKKIRQCFKFKNGKGFSGDLKEKADNEYCYPVYGGNGIIGYCNTPLLNKATIIVGRVGEYCGNVFKTQEKSWVTDNAMLVSEILLKDFDINFWTVMLNSLHFNHYSDSTGQPKITQGGIGAITMAYPKSAAEQTAIANILSKVDETIASVQNSIASVERLKKSLMQNLLTGKMKPDGTFRTPEEFYIDEKFGKVPLGWEVKRVKDFGEVITGKTPPTDEPEVFSDQERGYMFITPGDLDSAKYIEKTERYVSDKGIKYSYILPKNAVCEVCIGSTIGKIGITIKKCCTNQQLTSVIVNEENDAEYFYYAMCYRREHFKSIAGINATPQINKSGYSKYKVLCPKDKNEQIEIAQKINSVDSDISKQEQKIRVLERLRKSLMQNLLLGIVKTI